MKSLFSLSNTKAFLIAGSLVLNAAVSTSVFAQGGSNLGDGGDGNLHPVVSWCENNIQVLEQFYQAGMSQLIAGERSNAIDTLSTGLEEAIRQGSLKGIPTEHSLTWKAIARGIQMVNALESSCVLGSNREVILLSMLQSYYDFIRSIARSYEIPHHIPCRHGHCNITSEQLLTMYTDFVRTQLQWFLSLTTIQTKLNPQAPLVAKYSANLYLILLEQMLASISEDLIQTVFAPEFSCMIDRIRVLRHNVSAFNLGSRAIWSDARVAFYLTSGTVNEIQTALTRRCR